MASTENTNSLRMQLMHMYEHIEHCRNPAVYNMTLYVMRKRQEHMARIMEEHFVPTMLSRMERATLL